MQFKEQGDATAHFRAMLGRYRPGDVVVDGDAIELAALLKRHPEYLDKLGCGIRHFEVIAAEYGTQCFQIVRLDDTFERFSYPTCITGRARA
jgi:hypothetical protein